MRIFIEKDNGSVFQIKEIRAFSKKADILIFYSERHLMLLTRLLLEKELSKNTGTKCIVITPSFFEIVGLRTKKRDEGDNNSADGKNLSKSRIKDVAFSILKFFRQ